MACQGRLGQVLRLRLSRALDPKDFSEVEDFARACWSEVCRPFKRVASEDTAEDVGEVPWEENGLH